MRTEDFQDFEDMPDFEMDDIEMDLSMDFNDGFQDELDNRYINPPRRTRTPEHMLLFDRALKLASGMMMKGLLVFYAVIAAVCLYERNYPKALYWFSAGMITASVLLMK